MYWRRFRHPPQKIRMRTNQLKDLSFEKPDEELAF